MVGLPDDAHGRGARAIRRLVAGSVEGVGTRLYQSHRDVREMPGRRSVVNGVGLDSFGGHRNPVSFRLARSLSHILGGRFFWFFVFFWGRCDGPSHLKFKFDLAVFALMRN
jgi:hypothetical protein